MDMEILVWSNGWLGKHEVLEISERQPRTLISCGWRHVVCTLLDKDSRPALYAWGENVHGQLGTGDTRSSRQPRKVSTTCEDDTFISLASGRSHTLAVTSKGVTFAWGLGKSGRLGLGVPISHHQPCLLGHLRGVRIVEVACGSSHSLAVDENGGLWGWGCHKFGQLGLGDVGQESLKLPHQVDLLRSTLIASVAAGDKHSIALSSQGIVFSWGLNGYGCLGAGNARKNYPDFVEDDSLLFPEPFRVCNQPTRVNIEDSIAAISAGLFHSAAVGEKGKLYTWGKGGEGQLGSGMMADLYVPAAVKDLKHKNITKAACGSFHTAALTNEGELYVWGWAGDCNLLTRERSDEPLGPVLRPRRLQLKDKEEQSLFAINVCCGGSTLAVLVCSDRESKVQKSSEARSEASERYLQERASYLMIREVQEMEAHQDKGNRLRASKKSMLAAKEYEIVVSIGMRVDKLLACSPFAPDGIRDRISAILQETLSGLFLCLFHIHDYQGAIEAANLFLQLSGPGLLRVEMLISKLEAMDLLGIEIRDPHSILHQLLMVRCLTVRAP
mmetsp:Transcript_47486/g.148563  ORF Transcript_47486/g.148563 Transcript_47486/m.148563 type:complete len:556 (+) Transcript_47486:189-1856(+)